MKKIILATDFSAAATNAARYAYALASQAGLGIELLNVIELPNSMPVGTDPFWSEQAYEEVRKGALESMAKLPQRLARHKMTSTVARPVVSNSVHQGSLSELLAKKMRRKEMMMAVLGISDKTDAFSRFFFGSKTRELISYSHFPILLVPSRSRFKPFTKIAFASALDMDDVKRVKDLISLASPFHAEILVINICDTSTAIENMDKVSRFIKALSNCSDYDNVYYGHITNGNVLKSLEGYAQNKKADMLVMVHRKRHGLEGLFKNSLTKKVALQTLMPLLVLPEKISRQFFSAD